MRASLPVSDEDFERAHDLRQRDALVLLPVLVCLLVIEEHDEVLVVALVVDLDLVCFSASHDGYGFVVDVGSLDVSSRVFLGGGGGSCIGGYMRCDGR
jgi:hypothetical protein